MVQWKAIKMKFLPSYEAKMSYEPWPAWLLLVGEWVATAASSENFRGTSVCKGMKPGDCHLAGPT